MFLHCKELFSLYAIQMQLALYAPLCHWISHKILLKYNLVVQYDIFKLSSVIKFILSPVLYHMRR